MKEFISEDFLLQTESARRLYHDYAEGLPIIDYHCHLSPEYVADNHVFPNLSKIWLEGDHYKWRALRTNGVNERFITGDASDWEKFEKWAETVPYTMRNPLYHWTHLELTDGVWWFFLFWIPAYISDVYGFSSDTGTSQMLIFVLYAITMLSIYSGKLPTIIIEKTGLNPYAARMKAMFIFALFPLLAIFAQPLGSISYWYPIIIIGICGVGYLAAWCLMKLLVPRYKLIEP